MEKQIGIVILNYNTFDETEDLIKSIKQNTRMPYKIYLVDNCSTDGSYIKFKERYEGNNKIRVMKTSSNNGYSAGNNIGIKAAIEDNMEYLIIVNSDVILLNEAFDILCDALEQNIDCAIVGPEIYDKEKKYKVQYARSKLTLSTFLFSKHPLCDIKIIASKYSKEIQFDKNKEFKFHGMVSGCCFATKTSYFRDIGLFDEKIFLYYEEDILAYKVEKLGKKVIIENKAQIIHKEGASTSKKGDAFVQLYRWTSPLYVLKQYANVRSIWINLLTIVNFLLWLFLSIFSITHRKLMRKFVHQLYVTLN